MRVSVVGIVASFAVFLSSSCAPAVVDGPPFAMSFDRKSSLYDAPFPSDDLVVDGRFDLVERFQTHVDIVDQSLALIDRDARGFSQAGAVFFRAGAAVDASSLPDRARSTHANASVFIAPLDDVTDKTPIDVSFSDDGGPFGDARMLALLPLQGVPLRAQTTYVAVVTRSVRYRDGTSPKAMPPIDALQLAPNVANEFQRALNALATQEVALDDIAALAVYTTDDRTGDLGRTRADALAHHPVAPPSLPSLTDTFDRYCVFQSTVDVPVYQSGTAPYTNDGGDWIVDDTGTAKFDHTETGRIFITVPRATMPESGWPTVVFIGTGAGGDRALVDRGVRDANGNAPLGSGPAQELARVGWAAVQIDGTLEGVRNTTGGNEDFLVFNVFHPPALRDNIRQSALELALLPSMLSSTSFDTTPCAGSSSQFKVDSTKLALFGHSMGSSIAPLVLAVDDEYGTALLSGAGASYIANIMDKQQPLDVRPIAEALLGYSTSGRALTKFDPALTFFQWAVEPSDAQIYDAQVVAPSTSTSTHGRNVLMLQGIVDHYILPSIAEATSLAMHLDLAGDEIDDDNAELGALDQPPLSSVMSFAGARALSLPAGANRAGATQVVVQNPGDDVEDGHEVNFQTATPKSEYRCFLADVAANHVPEVRAPSSTDACYR